MDEGYLAIPALVVRNYRDLGIEHGEFGLICTILTYKHGASDPYPTHETLAHNLHCSERQVRKWVDSLEAKRLLKVGRRRKRDCKQLGPMVYNFKPLVDAALKLVGESPLPESNAGWEIEYRELVDTGPEVPLDTGLQVRKFGPQVPLNRSMNRSNKDDDLLRSHAREINEEPANQSESGSTSHSAFNDPRTVSRDSTGIDLFAWRESDFPVEASETVPLPIEPDFPEDTPSARMTQASETIARTMATQAISDDRNVAPRRNTDLPPSPTLDHVCDAVDRRMRERLGRWYIAKQGDYQAIIGLLAAGVPGDFLLSGIDYTFEHFADKHPNSFAYCSKIIAQLWANEQEKTSIPKPIDWTAYQQPMQRRSSRTMRNSMGSIGERPERDERYTAFYELFPDA